MENENTKIGIKDYILGGMILLVLVFSVVQSFQIKSIKQSQITGNAVQSNPQGNVVDTTGWTEDEKMNYEHHGTLPARLQGNSQPSSNMVGGC